MARYTGILPLASKIFEECSRLNQELVECHSPCHSPHKKMEVEEQMELIPPLSEGIDEHRKGVLGLLIRLQQLLQDPHEYLHEYVSSNWDHGALYVVLQANVLEMIPKNGSAHIISLAEQSNIPASKLLRILRLLACQHVVDEIDAEHFARTPVSEALVSDENFKAWVEFQLFETRVASAHLSDSLMQIPNDYENGQSAFRHAWEAEMYAWHTQRPEKAERFRKAMQGVSQSLDPADHLLSEWFQSLQQQNSFHIVEIGGRYGFASVSLASKFPGLSSEIRVSDKEVLQRGQDTLPEQLRSRIRFQHPTSNIDPQPLEDAEKGVLAYVARNVLWNRSDSQAVELLRTFLPVMQKSPGTAILVCDGVSPACNSFEPHIEQAYRRRDVTMMTMHNARQRSEPEWERVFGQVGQDLRVTTTISASAHVCKALFELRLKS